MSVRRLSALAIAVALLLPVAPIFTPLQQTRLTADVVLVLGPANESRLALAREILARGTIENLVISAPDRDDPVSKSQIDLCVTPQEFDVWCQRSTPFTTQGEIATLEALAVRNNWDSAIIITERTHASRAQLYADRCFSGQAVVEYVNEQLSPYRIVYEYAYESAAFLKSATVTTGCAG